MSTKTLPGRQSTAQMLQCGAPPETQSPKQTKRKTNFQEAGGSRQAVQQEGT